MRNPTGPVSAGTGVMSDVVATEVRSSKTARWLALFGFIALLAAFWALGEYFGAVAKLGGHVASAMLSFALLLGPYWAFGFGLDEWLRRELTSSIAKLLAPVALILPYLAFTLPRGEFRWSICCGLLGIVLTVTMLLNHARSLTPGWHDWLALAILGLSVEFHFFDKAWPVSGLSGMPKLLLVDAALYAYLIVRPIGGIGFDFRLHSRDLIIGLREFLYFTPIALSLGFLLSFLHLHKTLGNPLQFGAGWLFTLFFVAMPEELFFRGLLLNMLERRLGTRRALWITALMFGLAHFNKRAAFFNWRYVILAGIAGIFYGRAWLAQRRLLASSITHATVDTVWSIWLR
jgi:membrane protease YdiL (CAAX protease family)